MEGEEVDPVSLLNGFERQANGQVGFPHARWTQEEDILSLMEETQRGQFIDLSFGQLRLCLEVEVMWIST